MIATQPDAPTLTAIVCFSLALAAAWTVAIRRWSRRGK